MTPALTEAAAVIGPPVKDRFGRQLLKGQGREVAHIASGGLGLPVLPHHAVDIDIPDRCCAGAQFLDHLFARFDDRHAGGEITREPPVTPVNPIEAVSAPIERTWP